MKVARFIADDDLLCICNVAIPPVHVHWNISPKQNPNNVRDEHSTRCSTGRSYCSFKAAKMSTP